MRLALASLALAAAACSRSAPAAGSEPTERLYERLEGGEVLSIASIIRGEQGEPILQGPYVCFHRNGEIESTGNYEAGLRTGTWISRWPNGFLRSEGSYQAGEREGLWTLYSQTGRKSARGTFRGNRRSGAWVFWDENGEIDEARTGFYAFHTLTELDLDRPTGAWWEGETLDRDKHGRWSLFRSNGSLILTGDYEFGKAQGPWLLYAPDGSANLEWVSGEYRDGARIGPLTRLPPGATAPQGAADLERSDLPDADEGWLAHVDAALDPELPAEQSENSRQALLRQPRHSYPAILARLVALDLTQREDMRRGQALCGLLGGICGGELPWKASLQADAVIANQRTILGAYTLWELTRAKERIWSRDLLPQWRWTQLDRQFTVLWDPQPPDEFHRAIPGDGSKERLGPVQLALETRYVSRTVGRRRLLQTQGGIGTEEALAAALEYLAACQEPDGSWDPRAHEGDPRWARGVTAECLLALLGDSHTLDYGKHRDTVRRGLHQLVRAQDPKTGRVVEPHEEAHYEQALVLEALAEGAALSRLPALLQATVRGRDCLLGWQRPDGSWARDAEGAPDAATTARAILALLAVRQAAIEVAEEAVRTALAWLDGRAARETGHLTGGPRGALLPSHDPGVTALAALSRLFASSDPRRYRVFELQADWISLQAAHERALADVQNICWGSTLAIQLGGSAWQAWNAALKTHLIPTQRTEGPLRGSLDPAPWTPGGGGRLHATALFALSLETFYRYRLELRSR